jgi:hypothetical protein
MIAALLAAAVCAASPVHGEPLPQSGSLAGLRWVQATPQRAGIVGMLFAYDPMLEPLSALPDFALWAHGQKPGPGGWSMKILWIVRNVHAGRSIVVRGRQLDGARTFRQAFAAVTDASPQPAKGFEYASIVNLPSGGCWRLTVTSGGARGTLVARGVEP